MNNNIITNVNNIHVNNIQLNTINSSTEFVNIVKEMPGFANTDVEVDIFSFPPDKPASYSATIRYYFIQRVDNEPKARQGVGYVSFRTLKNVKTDENIVDNFVKSNWLFDGLNNTIVSQSWTDTSYRLTFKTVAQVKDPILISAQIQFKTH